MKKCIFSTMAVSFKNASVIYKQKQEVSDRVKEQPYREEERLFPFFTSEERKLEYTQSKNEEPQQDICVEMLSPGKLSTEKKENKISVFWNAKYKCILMAAILCFSILELIMFNVNSVLSNANFTNIVQEMLQVYLNQTQKEDND